MKKSYIIDLRMIIGEFEKMSFHFVTAETRKEACRMAIEAECHGEPEFTDDELDSEAWDCGQMVYRVSGIREVPEEYLEFTKAIFNHTDLMIVGRSPR